MAFRLCGTVCNLKVPRLRDIPWSKLTVIEIIAFIVVVTFLFSARHGNNTTGRHIETDDGKQHVIPKQLLAVPGVNHIVAENGELDGRSHTKLVYAMDRVHRDKRQELAEFYKEYLANHKRPTDKKFMFNVTLSEQASLDRAIIDSRPPVCKTRRYNVKMLPKASVVVVFYNEALSMLLRTVHSILTRSPDHLLNEVVLVDDASTHEYLKSNFEKYLSYLPKVRLIRNRRRQGLIRARLVGAKSCRGPVLIFLDAHTEANVGWLEPILFELKKHPSSVIQPFIDGIDRDTATYGEPYSWHIGAFNWELKYMWLKVEDHRQALAKEYGSALPTPSLVGCAIAVNMKYFYKMGTFDDGLKIWGGENIELSFRIWQCGGRVITLPCSRVGHLFKPYVNRFGKDDNEKTITKNLMRIADVWMDGMKKFFYAAIRAHRFRRVSFDATEQRSLAKRKQLRSRLRCKNFRWFMHNILPNVDIPPREAVYYGEITNLYSKACFDILEDDYIGITFMCFEHKIIPANNFYLTRNGFLKHKGQCVKLMYPNPTLKLMECPASDDESLDRYGKWIMEPRGTTWGKLKLRGLIGDANRMKTWCISQVTNAVTPHKGDQMPQVKQCNEDDPWQQWAFSHRLAFDAANLPV